MKNIEQDIDYQIEIKEKEIEILQLKRQKLCQKPIKENLEVESRVYRKYGKTGIQDLPQVQFLITLDNINRNNDYCEDNIGHFQLGQGKISKWSIQDIIILKENIGNVTEYPNFVSLGELIGINSTTTKELCFMIEHKLFDEYLEQWGEITLQSTFNQTKMEV